MEAVLELQELGAPITVDGSGGVAPSDASMNDCDRDSALSGGGCD